MGQYIAQETMGYKELSTPFFRINTTLSHLIPRGYLIYLNRHPHGNVIFCVSLTRVNRNRTEWCTLTRWQQAYHSKAYSTMRIAVLEAGIKGRDQVKLHPTVSVGCNYSSLPFDAAGITRLICKAPLSGNNPGLLSTRTNLNKHKVCVPSIPQFQMSIQMGYLLYWFPSQFIEFYSNFEMAWLHNVLQGSDAKPLSNNDSIIIRELFRRWQFMM